LRKDFELNLSVGEQKSNHYRSKEKTIMDPINENVEPNAQLLSEVDRPNKNIDSTTTTGWAARLEDWVNFLKDAVKILAE
jgi:hypothetical protein